MSVSWAEVSADFADQEGGLLDIYVLDTDLGDWQAVVDTIRRMDVPVVFKLGGEIAPLPDRIDELFAADTYALITFWIGPNDINLHFWGDFIDELEFDLDPRTVDGPDSFEALAAFIDLLGRTTDKVVLLTPESMKERPILRYLPEDGEVRWVPPTTMQEWWRRGGKY